MHKFFFYNKFIICLYMCRALCAHHQEVKIVLYSIWYHHTCRWQSRAQVERGPPSIRISRGPVSTTDIFSDAGRSTSHKAVRDVVPIKELMHKINLQATNTCKSCTNVKTLLHQTTSCAEAYEVRKWTRARLEMIHMAGT